MDQASIVIVRWAVLAIIALAVMLGIVTAHANYLTAYTDIAKARAAADAEKSKADAARALADQAMWQHMEKCP